MARDKIATNDRQLACARINSDEGQNYLKVRGSWNSIMAKRLLATYSSKHASCGTAAALRPRPAAMWDRRRRQLAYWGVAADGLRGGGRMSQRQQQNLPVPPGLPILIKPNNVLQAMACAANYAWVNRSSMTFLCRQAFAKLFKQSPDDLDMNVVYDVSHNIAKVRHAL